MPTGPGIGVAPLADALDAVTDSTEGIPVRGRPRPPPKAALSYATNSA
ncbi:hypothetical protein [Streptomyces finlayi]|nr:hypothetical protein [Streptomyces finlayi]